MKILIFPLKSSMFLYNIFKVNKLRCNLNFNEQIAIEYFFSYILSI